MSVRIESLDIVSIEDIGEQDVYDISILDNRDFYLEEPNFFANDVLVHNCHASGIIISNIPLSSIAPLRKTKKKSGVEEDGTTKFQLATQ